MVGAVEGVGKGDDDGNEDSAQTDGGRGGQGDDEEDQE